MTDKKHAAGFPIDRRGLLVGVAAGATAIASLGIPFGPAMAKETLTVADPGGPFGPAWDLAFVKPFEQEFGVAVNHIARQHYPATEIKANVQTKTYTWDVVIATLEDVNALEPEGLLEELDWSGPDMAELIPEARRKHWAGMDIYSLVMAYRTDKFSSGGPKSWADFWDVKKFPGRRALQKHPINTLEIALMADGVSKDALYPLDVDRAFKKLDAIKKDISVWWTSGAQTTQMLKSGEIDLVPTYSPRAQLVIDAGGPVKIEWNQGLYSILGWVIPKGNPKVELGRKFVKYCANAKRQAAWTALLADGPTNPNAYNFIPPERAKILPTAPEHFKLAAQTNPIWWATNKAKVIERFDAWLLA